MKVHPELAAITFLVGVHFNSFEDSKAKGRNQEMSSFVEAKTEKLVASKNGAWVDYNKRQMSRIYPAGLRVDSSNYDPVPSWNVGSQIVALNYQTPGIPMQLNDGKFADNGGCGYVLKPAFLRDESVTFDAVNGPFGPARTLRVTVLSAFRLPKPLGDNVHNVLDPSVKLNLVGVPADNQSVETAVIEDNGFNPVWNAKFELPVKCVDLAFLHVTVMSNNIFVAQRAMPVMALRQGVRRVTLQNQRGECTGDLRFASLLMEFELVQAE